MGCKWCLFVEFICQTFKRFEPLVDWGANSRDEGQCVAGLSLQLMSHNWCSRLMQLRRSGNVCLEKKSRYLVFQGSIYQGVIVKLQPDDLGQLIAKL